MTTTVASRLEPEYHEPIGPPDPARHAPANHRFDPTQGRTIGANPYDDPTQGRKIGANPYDDPTRGA